MLSRKNYESAAEIFRVARTRQKLGGGAGGSEALDSLAAEFADYFARDNGRFDRERWELACIPSRKV